MSKRLRLDTAIVLAVAALAGACVPLRRRASGASASVVFVNESSHQAAVYAFSRTSNGVRIGTVMSGSTDTLSVPGAVLGGTVTLVARALDAPAAASTGPVTLMAGDRLRLVLPVNENVLLVVPPRTP